MLRIEGIVTHQIRNSHLIFNLERKSAIKAVSEDKREIPQTILGVV